MRDAVDLPPFRSSAMDGYAVRSADAPGRLRVVGRLGGRPAGSSMLSERARRSAIATGGVVPDGADAVVPIEYVVESDNDDRDRRDRRPATNVRPVGGDVRRGDVAARRRHVLGPGQLGALAAAGVAEPACARRPRAAVLSTGTELRRPGEPLGPGEIYESNAPMLAAALAAAGAEVERLTPVADDADAHREALERGLAADVLVSSGGVSMGPHDLVRATAAGLGVEEVFWRVAVKPGKPVAFGVRGPTLVFGLPGNPVSALVGFELFVRPAVRALQGAADPGPVYRSGRLGRALRRNEHRDELVRARGAETRTGRSCSSRSPARSRT